ncbi:hypothetical protein FACS1894190_16350 [Spirochaetia bacterium]|nr:hypothetical protein FACS1894190_16350 [Spirochaetia bacterium]
MKKFLLLGGVVTVIAMAIFIGCSQPAGETDAMDEDSGKLPALTGSVSITGTKAVDGKLTAKTSALGGSGAIAYKWTNSKEGSAVIGTSPTYTVTEDDNNSIIRVTVSRAGYSGVKNASVTIGTVEPTPVVTHAPDEPWLIGEQGPAGGTVFFVNDDHDTYGKGWDYLEAAPHDVPGLFAWASDGCKDIRLDGDFSTDIGKGWKNTTELILVASGDPDAPAAKAATGYELNGFTDWFLPSSGELNAMYENRAVINGDFADSFYWSSSQNQDANDEAWYQRFDNGDIYYYGNKYGTHYVRPVRAFLATPEPTDSPEPDPTATPTDTPTPAPSGTPTSTPSSTSTASPTATPSGSPAASPTASATPTSTPTATPSGSPAASPTASATPSASASPTASATPTPTPTSTPTPNPSSPSIAAKFGIDVTDNSADKVTEVFTALHHYIQDNPDNIGDLIKLGDYIDLHSLYVEGDTGQPENADYGYINATNTDVTDLYSNPHGKLLRLIVVGINSFNYGGGTYTGNGNNTPHVVFHFQNIPGKHKMNNSDTNTTGYLNSAMRKYLVPVGDDGGNFLTGLKGAGVPEEVLWAPIRIVASSGSGTSAPQTITDKLWLPTEREMFGNAYTYGPHSVTAVETDANQTSFTGFYTTELYNGDATRKKGVAGAPSLPTTNYYYWLASPSIRDTWSRFCFVDYNGQANHDTASSINGCAPAFCVE